MQGQVDCKPPVPLFKDEVVLRLRDVNAALLYCIQRTLQQEQRLRSVCNGNDIEVTGPWQLVAEFREMLRSEAAKCSPRDRGPAETTWGKLHKCPRDVLTSLCTTCGAFWHQVGTSLGLSSNLLDGIAAVADDGRRMQEVLLVWIATDPDASWHKLASAVTQDFNISDSDYPLPSVVCSLITGDNVQVFGGLSPDTLGLLELLPEGNISGVRSLPACGQVLIEGPTKTDIERCIERFQTVYQELQKIQRVESIQCPTEMDASSLGRLVDALRQSFNQCTFTYSPQTHTIRIVSNSARQLDSAKQDIAGYMQAPTAHPPGAEVSRWARGCETQEVGGDAHSAKHRGGVPLATPSSVCDLPHIIFGERILKLKKSDIVHEQVDVIVNPANSQLKHQGGVAKAIDKASHGNVQRQSSALVQQYGPLPMGDVTVTGAGGDLKCHMIYHVVGPVNAMPPEECRAVIHSVVTKVLALGEQHGKSFIAFPAISTGAFGVDRDLVAHAMIDTILRYRFTRSAPVMADIRIVVIDDPTYDCFARCFAEVGHRDAGGVPRPMPYDRGASGQPRPMPWDGGASVQPCGNNSEEQAEALGYEVIRTDSYGTCAGQPSVSVNTNEASHDPSPIQHGASHDPSPTQHWTSHDPSPTQQGASQLVGTEAALVNARKESSSANKEVPYMESSAPYKELPHTSPPIPAYRLLGGTMKEITHHMPLPGYGQCGTIWVTYHIPGGTQGPNHPNPGHQYSELKLRVFLPDNFEGRRVLELLRRAWEAGVIFTVQNDAIATNIELKTQSSGGPNQNGYPDANYLERVTGQLTEVLKVYTIV